MVSRGDPCGPRYARSAPRRGFRTWEVLPTARKSHTKKPALRAFVYGALGRIDSKFG